MKTLYLLIILLISLISVCFAQSENDNTAIIWYQNQNILEQVKSTALDQKFIIDNYTPETRTIKLINYGPSITTFIFGDVPVETVTSRMKNPPFERIFSPMVFTIAADSFPVAINKEGTFGPL